MHGGCLGVPSQWIQHHLAGVRTGDVRRDRRVRILGAQIAADPGASLPRLTGPWKHTKAAYRLLDTRSVTFRAMVQHHWSLTAVAAASARLVRFVHDGTELCFGAQSRTRGLGPVGRGNQSRGLLLQSTLAVLPGLDGGVLGLAHQHLWARAPTRPKETEHQRRRRWRETCVWPESIRAVGRPPPGRTWIHIGDRQADTFEVFQACQQTGSDFVIRVAGATHRRRVVPGHAPSGAHRPLLEWTRELEARGGMSLDLRSRPGQPARRTRLLVAAAAVTVLPADVYPAGTPPVRAWAVRVWEAGHAFGVDPKQDQKKIEWVLLTSLPIEGLDAAADAVGHYAGRWVIEEYHKCLKTGCAVESRQLEEASRLEPLIGLLSVVAVGLLGLKFAAKATPERPAEEVVGAEPVRVLAAYRGEALDRFTCRHFWREVAKLGGFLGRKHDGDPGWQTLWCGWQKLSTMIIGARLTHSPGEESG